MANVSSGPTKNSKVVMFYFVPQGQKTLPPPDFFRNACATALDKNMQLSLPVISGPESQPRRHSINFHKPISLATYSNFLNNKNAKDQGDGPANDDGSTVLPNRINIINEVGVIPSVAPPLVCYNKKYFRTNAMQVQTHKVEALLSPIQQDQVGHTLANGLVLNERSIPVKKLIDANYISSSPPPDDCLDDIRIESIVSLANPNDIFEPEVIINEEPDEIIPINHLTDYEMKKTAKKCLKVIKTKKKRKFKRMNLVLPPGMTIKEFKYALSCRVQLHKLSDDEVESLQSRRPIPIEEWEMLNDEAKAVEPEEEQNATMEPHTPRVDDKVQRPLFSDVPSQTAENILLNLKAKLQQTRKQLEDIRAEYNFKTL